METKLMTLKTTAIAILTTLACIATPARCADLGRSRHEDAHQRLRRKTLRRVVRLKQPIHRETGKPKIDKENPDASKPRRPLIGFQVINGANPAKRFARSRIDQRAR
jgi:hypothetical protein